MSRRRTFRTLVAQKAGLVVPGAYDGVSARLVERAGFSAAYMTGYGAPAPRDPDLLIIARTDAISAVDFDESLRRGEAAAKAGADVLFIEAPRAEAQVERIAREFDTPLLYNYAPGGRSPLLPFARLRELRYAIILLPVDTLFVAGKAVADFLHDLRAGDDVRSLADRYIAFGEFNDLIGVTAQLALAERYRDDGG